MREQDRLVVGRLRDAAAANLRPLTRGEHHVDQLDLAEFLEESSWLMLSRAPKAKVFTTTPFRRIATQPCNVPKEVTSRNPTSSRGPNMTRISRNYQLPANFG